MPTFELSALPLKGPTMKLCTPVIATLLSVLALGANAHVGSVDQRQASQAHRIARGVATGALTPHEAHRLHDQQRSIGHAERHARADGIVTGAESMRLNQLQTQASHHISHQTHDAQRRRCH
jgi:hypothetical protein